MGSEMCIRDRPNGRRTPSSLSNFTHFVIGSCCGPRTRHRERRGARRGRSLCSSGGLVRRLRRRCCVALAPCLAFRLGPPPSGFLVPLSLGLCGCRSDPSFGPVMPRLAPCFLRGCLTHSLTHSLTVCLSVCLFPVRLFVGFLLGFLRFGRLPSLGLWTGEPLR